MSPCSRESERGVRPISVLLLPERNSTPSCRLTSNNNNNNQDTSGASASLIRRFLRWFIHLGQRNMGKPGNHYCFSPLCIADLYWGWWFRFFWHTFKRTDLWIRLITLLGILVMHHNCAETLAWLHNTLQKKGYKMLIESSLNCRTWFKWNSYHNFFCNQ